MKKEIPKLSIDDIEDLNNGKMIVYFGDHLPEEVKKRILEDHNLEIEILSEHRDKKPYTFKYRKK